MRVEDWGFFGGQVEFLYPQKSKKIPKKLANFFFKGYTVVFDKKKHIFYYQKRTVNPLKKKFASFLGIFWRGGGTKNP